MSRTSNPWQQSKNKSSQEYSFFQAISEPIPRARAGLNYWLTEKIKQGHCAYPQDQLITEVSARLKINEMQVQEALEQELEAGSFIAEEIHHFLCVYPKKIYEVEKEVAQLLAVNRVGDVPWPFPSKEDKTLKKVEKLLDLKLTPIQKLAMHTALINKFCVITGGPGTGKSTFIKALSHYLKNFDARIALAAPTEPIAERLGKMVGIEAKTLHQWLSYDQESGQFKPDQIHPLDIDLMLVDETSMMDLYAAQALLRALPAHATLVLVGDGDQLSSLGPGQFLKDVIQSEKVPVVTLTQILPAAAHSQIIQAAHQIKKGVLPDLTPHRHSDFFFLPENSIKNTFRSIIDLITHRLPTTYGFDPARDIQILSPTEKGLLGTKNLNPQLQKILSNNFKASFENASKELINQLASHSEVKNTEAKTGLPDYAHTIHQAQGMEYPVVIIPIVVEHQRGLHKTLIYTGVTRGKKLVILVGQTKALQLALSKPQRNNRWTKLRDRLKQANS